MEGDDAVVTGGRDLSALPLVREAGEALRNCCDVNKGVSSPREGGSDADVEQEESVSGEKVLH